MTRKLSLIVYGKKEELVKYLTQNKDKIKKYAYILHDKDGNEPHWHMYIYYNNATTFERVKKQISKYTNQNVLAEEAIDENGLMAYMTHVNETDKHQYNVEDVILSNDFYKIENTWLNMYIDFVENKCKVRVMIEKYGKDFVINIKNFRDLRAERQQEVIEEKIFLKNNKKSVDKE